ncbi:MAG TPA: hypothetical protein PK205_18655 [Promineifilum sp.]|nr:hypothetical protein [Promineifilum sp.]
MSTPPSRVLHRTGPAGDAGGFDDLVKRISTAYDARGLATTVTQHTHASVGSGSVVDEVEHAYG